MGGDRENESTTSLTGHEKIKTTNTGIECHDPIWLICGLCTIAQTFIMISAYV
jgi:hypothetical protein